MSLLRMIGALILGLSACIQASAAPTTAWPSRPITIVVPFPAGPGIDFVVRLLGEKVSATLGQPVIIENKPGASGRVAAEYVAHAAPDGYTLFAATTSTNATSVHLVRKMPYDPVKDFTPIILAVDTIGAIVVNQTVLPVNSIKELIELAKKKPGFITYGTSGIGSIYHLAGEYFNQTCGVQLLHVPYHGSVQAFTDLLGGHVQMNFAPLAQAVATPDDRKVKILALIDETRFSMTPDIPSISEIALAYRMPSSWNGIVGPAGLPPEIVQRLYQVFADALKDAGVRKKLEGNGYRVVSAPPDQLARRVRSDIDAYGRIIEAAHIEPQ